MSALAEALIKAGLAKPSLEKLGDRGIQNRLAGQEQARRDAEERQRQQEMAAAMQQLQDAQATPGLRTRVHHR